MFEVHFKGFNTEAQAMAFVDAYEGQGQDTATIWFECRYDDGELDVTSMDVDMSKYPLQCIDGIIEVHVRPR